MRAHYGKVTAAFAMISALALSGCSAGGDSTEAGAEAISRDIAARHGRRGGRPPLAEETSRLGLRLPRELHERLREAAHQAGISESELAREAIDDYLAKGA